MWQASSKTPIGLDKHFVTDLSGKIIPATKPFSLSSCLIKNRSETSKIWITSWWTFMFSPGVLLYMLDWSETDSTMIKSRCPSLLRSCRVFWASCSRFRFWFNWSVWFWRDEMRTAADVSTCCMNPASSTSKQRRSSPNSFLTTHFNTSDSFWLDRERQLRLPPSIGWPLQQKQNWVWIQHSQRTCDELSSSWCCPSDTVTGRSGCTRVQPEYWFRNTQQSYESYSVVYCESLLFIAYISHLGLKEFQMLFNFQHTYSQLFLLHMCYIVVL